MLRLHFWSDLFIFVAYLGISLTLVHLVRRGRREIPFHWMFLAFGTFIIACGCTHLMEVITLTRPVYWLSGMVKGLTAMVSVATALALPPLVPRALDLVRAAKTSEEHKRELEVANAALQREIGERRKAEEEIRKLANKLEIRVKERTAELMRANEELLEKAAIVQHSYDAIISLKLDGTITSWNPAAELMYGYSVTEIVGGNVEILAPADRKQELGGLMERLKQGEEFAPFETQRIRKDGTVIDVSVAISILKDSSGTTLGASLIERDITERKRAEGQLRQVQKLESLGVIAGGVAHDFNNLLVGILGNASLIQEFLPASGQNSLLIGQVLSAAEKAAHLTQQMLAYAGKGRFVLEKLDLSGLVREISDLIKTSIPKTVQLRLELDPNLPAVEADPGQLQQVVMNLVINAAEAIGENSGTVLVTTTAQTMDSDCIRLRFPGESLEPGAYIVLEVHDNGIGMDEAVRSRIFDPFFTTKFTGRGLGLSAVLGIVKSHRGTIRVYSEPEKGSTFKIMLPAVEGVRATPLSVDLQEELRGSGLILVVDDEEVVRKTALSTLNRYGYSVITANDGQAGVEMFRRLAGEISAVLLDMTMPVMGGAEAFRQIRVIRPDARVIVSSGYNEVEAVRRFTAKGIAAFVQKPYTAAKLARVVKKTLVN